VKVSCPHCGKPLELVKARGKTFDRDAAYALLRMGATPGEVAQAFGVHRQTIYMLRREREGS